MSKNVLAVIEQRNGLIKKSSLEAVSAAIDLAAKLGVNAIAVVIGSPDTQLSDLNGFNLEKITFLNSPELAVYSPSAYKSLLTELINKNDVEVVLLSNTSFGKDLAPRLSGSLKAAILTDITSYSVDGPDITITRPIYAGKAVMQAKVKGGLKVLTLRPNVFPVVKTDVNPVVENIPVSSPDLSTKVIEIKKNEGKLDVAEADIIVSGGRGLKEAANFSLIEELAESLGAAVGASRAVVDAGWRPHSEQVGQTGKTVSPNLYIAVGISGAIQHLAGMSSSKYIVAVNKDKDAPIFSVADYGIAGDAFEVLPALISEIKKLKS